MPPESERPIEKLLRSCARRRRDVVGDDWKLHPVSRQNLQREVAQKYGTRRGSSGGAFRDWIRSWRFAFVGGLAAAMVAGVVWLAVAPKRQDATLLARNDSAGDQNSRDLAAQSSPPALGENERLSKAKDAAEIARLTKASPGPNDTITDTAASAAAPSVITPGPLAKQQLALAPPVAAPANAPADALAANAAFTKRYGFAGGATPMKALPPGSPSPATEAFAEPTPGPMPSAPLPEVQLAQAVGASSDSSKTPIIHYGNFTAQTTEARQRSLESANTAADFSSPALKQRSPASVLTQFRIERDGLDVRVIDSDGSVYSGQLQTGSVALVRATLSAESAAPRHTLRDETKTGQISQAAAVKNQPMGEDLVFRVEGTNITLQLPVVFSGTLIMPKPSPDGPTSGVEAGRRAFSPAIVGPSHVSGTVLLGKDQRLKIEAQPVKPATK